MSPFALRINHLTKQFGGVRAVRDLQLDVTSNAIFGMLGPNGSGKTTAFNLISGLTKPDQGEVELLGKPVTGMPPHKICGMGLARTFQNLRLFNGMSVMENVLTGGHRTIPSTFTDAALSNHRHHRSEHELLDRAHALLVRVNLTGSEHLLASQLPYGAARRLEIARALMTQPSVLLLDEPAAGMNPVEALELAHLIRSIRDSGITVFVIEHNVKWMVSLCDRIAVLNHGEKIAEGTPSEIVSNPAVIEAYLGTPETTP